MKILHLNHFGSSVGGVECYISDVSSMLATVGHESRLISFAKEDPDSLMPGTVQVAASHIESVLAGLGQVIVDWRPDVAYLHAVYQARIVQWIAEKLPTVAYVHGAYLVCPGFAQFLRASGRVCPYSATPHCLIRAQTERCCFGRNPLRHWHRLREVQSFIAIYRRLRILVGSRFMQGLLQRNNLPQGKIDILAPFLVEDPPPKETAITNRDTIAFAGRLTPDKGLPDLIRALSAIHRPWRLLVAGDGAGRTECDKLIAQLGIGDRVRFLGWLARPKLAQLYRESSFLVVPSLLPESFGRVGPEAATHGRAAVAFEAGGVSDWLVDGVTGYLVPPGDTSRLSDRIERLLDSPARQVEMGEQARALALAKWGSSRHADELIGHLLSVQSDRSN